MATGWRCILQYQQDNEVYAYSLASVPSLYRFKQHMLHPYEATVFLLPRTLKTLKACTGATIARDNVNRNDYSSNSLTCTQGLIAFGMLRVNYSYGHLHMFSKGGKEKALWAC